MKTYRLFTDSTADLSGAYYRAHDVTVLPYTYICLLYTSRCV